MTLNGGYGSHYTNMNEDGSTLSSAKMIPGILPESVRFMEIFAGGS